jgi:type IV pilus assembly protein PilX
MTTFIQASTSRRRQQGAALFVGLILLILMALIGLAAMQSTLLQERMAGNFRILNQAFQNAEATLRLAESRIQADANANLAHLPDRVDCTPINYGTWVPPLAGATLPAPATQTQKLDQCIATWAGGEFGQPRNVKVDDLYRVSSFAPDAGGSRAASAVVDSIYIP